MTKKEVAKGKISTYAVIMLLSAIIIIIIAAMADNREARFITEIEATNQTNMTIQNEIVSLKDENYALKNEKESLSKQLEEISAENKIYNISFVKLFCVWTNIHLSIFHFALSFAVLIEAIKILFTSTHLSKIVLS